MSIVYDNTWTLCTGCADLIKDGRCRACDGTDFGRAKPPEIDGSWERIRESNGVTHYHKADVIWACDLAGDWFRYPRESK